MKRDFTKVRFLIFTQSYVGYRMIRYINNLKDSKYFIKRLGEILGFDEKYLKCFILHKNCRRKFKSQIKRYVNNNKEVNIYLQIEQELIALTYEKEMKEDPENEDYNERALLSVAIERAAGNTLSYIQTDSWFDRRLEKVSKQYNRRYYKVVDAYKLPTMRIVPFLLRIMRITNV